MTSNFLAYDENYKDGVALSTGWVAGGEGGAKSIITSQLAGAGTVRVWSTGSKLDGQPSMYLESPNHHEENIEYAEIASFAPFAGAPGRDRCDVQHRLRSRSTRGGDDPCRPGAPQVHPRAPGAGRYDVGAEADRHPAEDADGPDTARRPLGQVPEHLGHEVEDQTQEQPSRR